MRCPTAHLIGGAFDATGRFIDWLAPYFQAKGYKPDTDFDYGWTGIVSAWVFTDRWARLLKSKVKPGDTAAGHSNGCLIIAEAARMGAPLKEIVLLHPALDRGYQFAPQLEHIYVFHSPSEWPTRIARLIPAHPWGDMGRVGYQGDDPRIVNLDVTTGPHPVYGHTGEHRTPEFWGPLVACVNHAEVLAKSIQP